MTKQTTTTKTFEQLNENGTPIYRWTMELIKRQGKKIWVMNHLFLNPDYDQKAIFEYAPEKLFFPQRILPGLENRLKQIIEYALLARHNIHSGHHTWHDGQFLATIDDGGFGRTHLDLVIEFTALILDGVGADLLEHTIQPSIDGKVVSGNFDHSLLART